MLFKRKAPLDKQRILGDIATLVHTMFLDGDILFERQIGPQTLVKADLALKSVEIVRLAAAIRKQYGNVDLPFNDLLMPNGCLVEDVSLSDIVDFLFRHLKDS